jgi:hypothetical protein
MDKRQISALIKELAAERDNLDKTIEFLTSRFQSGNYRELTTLAVSQPDGKKRGRPRTAQLKAIPATKPATKRSKPKRKLSDEARKKMSDAAKRRHANKRKQSTNA